MASDRPSRFQSFRTRAAAGIGGVAALVTSWGIGLFEAKSEPAPPGLSAGRAIAAGEWELRLGDVQTGNVTPDGRVSTTRGALMLTARVTNRTGRSSNSYNQVIKLETPIAGIDPQPTAYLVRDREMLTQLHPAMPEDVVLVWTYPRDARVPNTVRFAIEARDFKPRDNLYAAAGWFNPHIIGTIELPVTQTPFFAPRPFGAAR